MTTTCRPTFQCTVTPGGQWSYYCAYCNERHTHKPGPGTRCAHCRPGTPLHMVTIQIELAPSAQATAHAAIRNDASLHMLLRASGLTKHPYVIAAIVAAASMELEAQP